MEEQILIHYHKTGESFLLAIVNGDNTKCFNTQTEEALSLVEQIKNIIE